MSDQVEAMKVAHKKYQTDYEKYVEYCKSLGKEPRKWYEWNYCTYSAFEESWRLHH